MNLAKILALGVGLMLGASTLSAQGRGQGAMGYRMMPGGCARTTAAQGRLESPQGGCGKASEARHTRAEACARTASPEERNGAGSRQGPLRLPLSRMRRPVT
jgi:hypothetical protein